MKLGEAGVPGWYEDPTDADRQRFWDGDEWTEKARPAPLLRPRDPLKHQPSRQRQAREPVSQVVIAGYMFAVLFPLLGFILGLTQINRSEHGLRIVVGSVLFAFLWAMVLT